MLRGIMIVGALMVGSLILVHTVLANGSVLQYMDNHPDPRWVPNVEYYLGEVYYFFQDIPTASIYFNRICQRYPKSPLAEEAYYAFLQCEDDTLGISRDILIAEDQKYVDMYPSGPYTTIIRNRIDALRSGAR